MRGLFLGVDGGQSGTVALIGDESGLIVGVGRAGPCNHVGAAEGRARFLSALGESVTLAAAGVSETGLRPDAGVSGTGLRPDAVVRPDAGVSGTGLRPVQGQSGGLAHYGRNPHFTAACLGFSGGPADKEALTREIVAADRYAITDDASIALTGATAGEPGIIVIAGTGSIAFGRNAEGRTARAGGWGYIFGDEGGAFDLVRQATRALLRQDEGWGTPTRLRNLFLEATGASDANDLLHRFYTDEYPRARVASLAPLIGEAAEQGDAVAADILKGAAQALATIASTVRSQLFRPGEKAVVSYIGGVFQNRTILERFRMLMELDDANGVAAPVYGPAAGALIEAYRLGGVTCTLKGIPEAL